MRGDDFSCRLFGGLQRTGQNRLVGWNLAQEQDDSYETDTRKESVWPPEGKSRTSEIQWRYFQEPEIISLAGTGPSLEKGFS